MANLDERKKALNELIAQAQEAVQNGDLEKAKQLKADIEVQKKEYEELTKIAEEFDGLEIIEDEVPEVIEEVEDEPQTEEVETEEVVVAEVPEEEVPEELKARIKTTSSSKWLAGVLINAGFSYLQTALDMFGSNHDEFGQSVIRSMNRNSSEYVVQKLMSRLIVFPRARSTAQLFF